MTTTGKFYIESKKIRGEAPISGSVVANWNATESDIVSIGAAGKRHLIHSLLLDIDGFVGIVTVRLYITINGTERQSYSQNFSVAADGPGLWVINGTIGIHGVLRVTAQSDNAADDGKPIGYTYMLEVM